MQILVTNDDGPASPLVSPLIRAAASLGTVTVVLPATERSWTAKAMTRYADLPLARRDHPDRDGNAVSGFTLGGTPADCVNAGCYLLGPRPPDLVLSGVNAGENTGVSYAAGSGTIGACLEANIALVPAIALSQQLTPAGFASWAAPRAGRAGNRARRRARAARPLAARATRRSAASADRPGTRARYPTHSGV
ncbi:5'-nucleotidase SurE [Geodia barretti]|uniref:5'-nucleotidase SurE n=1 Tax=Geodia barretti TaxID=519541 RepID=A0AA35TTJ2_GEOBA|nr:5'-nucleotidase SurE [Geodia barretti]